MDWSIRAVLICLVVQFGYFSVGAQADEIEYDLKLGTRHVYKITANSFLDFGQYAGLAGALGIRRMGQSSFIECELEGLKRLEKSSALFRGTIKRVSLINIYNDSLYAGDSLGWDIFRPGQTGSFILDNRGRLGETSAKTSQTDRNFIAFWKAILPEFPDHFEGENSGWKREIEFIIDGHGNKALPVTCQFGYTYAKSRKVGGKKGTIFEYTLSGFSPDNADFRMSGSGEITFDSSKGKMTRNFCKVRITGFGGFGNIGLPADWAGKIPLAINSEIEVVNSDESR